MGDIVMMMIERQIKAAETWAMVNNSNKIMEKFTPCGPPSTHCFRIPVRPEVIEGANLPFSKVSIAHPPDTDLYVFEIALYNDEDKLIYVDYLGMSDIYRFFTFKDLEEGLTRLANNQSVDITEDDDEE